MHKVNVSYPIVQMSDFTSLMHHFNTPRTRMHSQYIMPVHSPIFASSYYRLLKQKVPAGYNGHMHKMCLHWDHTYGMTTGLHACQYCTCMHILSDFDSHNITHSTAWMVRQTILVL